MKILVVVGARPNFVKVAPLMEKFKKYRQIKPILVHTGQHYDYEMSQIFFRDFNIPKPNYNLGVGSLSHARQTAKIIEKLEKVALKEKPDRIVVFGDVNSTLAGALVGAKLNIPVAHVEAGLRSFDKTMPEEINRLLTDHVSEFLFCPTENAVKNLKKEGIKKGVHNVGDIMYDALLGARKKIKKSKILKRLNLSSQGYILMTIHRASNTDNLENLRKIIASVGKSGEKVVFPIHPRTRKQLKKLKLSRSDNLKIIRPVSYLDMLALETGAKKILTDSGGIQKEAYWLKVPCITLRRETEWVETVRGGWNVLTGASESRILKAIKTFNPKKKQKNYFGKGDTAKIITKIILNK